MARTVYHGSRKGRYVLNWLTKRWVFSILLVTMVVVVAGCGSGNVSTNGNDQGQIGTQGLTPEQEAELEAQLAELRRAAEQTNLPIVAPENVDGDVTGDVTGLMDGKRFHVYTMISDLAQFDEPLNSASWSDMGSTASATILAYREGQTDRRGMVMVELRFDVEDDQLIPRVEDNSFTYFESAFRVFGSEQGTVQVTSVERGEDDTLAISGTFGGVVTEYVTEDTVEITDGSFTVGNIPMVAW